jgi:hypothetical protein
MAANRSAGAVAILKMLIALGAVGIHLPVDMLGHLSS